MLNIRQKLAASSARWVVDAIGVGAVLLVAFVIGCAMAALRIESARLERERLATIDVSRSREQITAKSEMVQRELKAAQEECLRLRLDDESVTEDAGFLKLMSGYASRFELSLEELRPATTRPNGADMNVTLKGSFAGICSLLAALEDLPSQLEIVNGEIHSDEGSVGICRAVLLIRLDRAVATRNQVASQGGTP